MITPAFNITATERVLPKLALDFTTAVLDSRVTFTRTTSASNPATYTDVNGYIVSATNNQPRFDYDPITIVCRGLLIEESRTNSILQSQDFATTWSPTGTTVFTNTAAAPDGLTTADKIQEDSASSLHNITQAFPATSGTTYTGSIYVKPAGRSYLLLAFTTAFTTTSVQYDLINGTSSTGTGTPLAQFIQPVGNGWYRCGFSLAATSTTNGSFNVYVSANGLWANRTYVGDGASGLYLWGAQVEAGAFATSYIPTTTTALTRNADVAVMTGTNFSDWFNTSEGTFACQWKTDNATTAYYTPVQIDDGTNNNRFACYRNNSATSIRNLVMVGGTGVATLQSTITSTIGTNRTTLAYKVNDFAGSVNGTTIQTDTAGAVPTVNQLRFGSAVADANTPINGCIQNFMYWPSRLTNAETQAFSKQG